MTAHITQPDYNVLIAAKPDRMRRSLKSLLAVKPGLTIVSQTSEGGSVLQTVNQHQPTLMVLDTNMPHDWRAILTQVKTASPDTICLVLADVVHQPQVAKAAGADAVLTKGYPLAKLYSTIDHLLSANQGVIN